MRKNQDRRKRKIKEIQKDDIGATAIFVINRNGGCPLFLFSQKIILLSAFIYECVDQPRKWMFQGDWGCATTSFLHRIRIHALLAD